MWSFLILEVSLDLLTYLAIPKVDIYHFKKVCTVCSLFHYKEQFSICHSLELFSAANKERNLVLALAKVTETLETDNERTQRRLQSNGKGPVTSQVCVIL